ncbi:hypothetical protein BBK36DRAFT_1161436 [Trichoderma citrinoviride]|uniref:Aminoglycoside phosphotransferase domain-containing protein n=1 Tax=Trichoderma citrinoviride TaxID=58853 RepID=A0A2T4B4X8_9HYPO|nr:hypothetical protein BBK36DRAFT_1161436 [Trichoderma citrinoviride]PTB64382.1 hypothetical protein BBK36DRAFT_1161436 [Trichoderma citrinoviride]
MAWGSTEKASSYTANAEIRPDDDEDIEAFFTRNGFDGKTREACDEYARMRFPGVEATPSPTQGYCSYTLSLSKDYLLQFRPVAFMLDMNTCREAKAIYGRYAPTTTYLGEVQGIPSQDRDGHVSPPMMHVYLHKRIPGIPLSEFRRRRKDGMKGREAEAEDRIYKRRLMRGLAKVFALGFRARQPFKECISKGRIGESMQWRLSLLNGLPSEDADLQRHVSEAQSQFHGIQASDWCLTHGDLLPANILVHPKTGRLTGLIDWAEAEWLPFGMALYGIEEMLGETVVPSSQGFRYYADHRELRHLFWCEFLALTGQRRMSAVQVQRVEAARKLGILFWRGIAFDDGRMDRVVEEGRDEEELQKLRLFLRAPGVSEGSGRVRDKR